jgi:hypothetical protein
MDKFPISGEQGVLESQRRQNLLEYTKLCRNRVNNFLLSHDIDVGYAKKINVNERNDYLINILVRDRSLPDSAVEETVLDTSDHDIGILLVKPEIIPFRSKVIEYLEKKDIECVALEHIYPTHRDWMETYGYMLERYPDVINLYIMQRSLGFQPILFRHFSTNAYISLLEPREKPLPKDGDRDAMFDQLFCGEASDNHPMTLRGEVSFPTMKRLGFDDMSGYASLFDPVGFFRDTGMLKNYRAYNGIHIPSNSAEKGRNLRTFLRNKHSSDA